MKIAMGADHAGFEYKERLMLFLKSEGYNIIDCGTDSEEQVDYPVYAEKVCRLIESASADTGILICGTGIGMSMAANRHKSIRAAVCGDSKSAEFTRLHNDANILCLGARIISYELAQEIVKIYLSTDFLGGKHLKRLRIFS
ncbi:MAG: ribose 5-phosphate isomerase B [Bacteroides sp.]|nr:ribose 5-phosphate isomerase B [Prevotella sp.]MCM1407869.1 ribose 5-phosphate isomerase B [Treponema brennaborense]MCM1469611.1 ribose 5-phosphate isomerase B [Bacteroides sp.]